MALELNGTTGVSLVQDGVVTAADLASGAITASALPAGSVLQVVQDTQTAETNYSSGAYQDTDLSVAITPSSTSSKVLVIVDIGGDVYSTSSALKRSFAKIVRDSTSVFERVSYMSFAISGDNYGYTPHGHSFVYLDSPSTTSSTTYKIQVRLDSTADSTGMRVNSQGDRLSSITLMEIAG